MKLYCIKIYNSENQIVDIFHEIINSNDLDKLKKIHKKFDKFIEDCKKYDIKDYISYGFFEVSEVNGFNFK